MRALAVCLVLLVQPPGKAAAPVPADSFEFVVRQLDTAEGALRRQFATVALLHLTEVYFGEAGLARRQTAGPPSRHSASLRRWSRAVEKRAEGFLLLHDAALEGLPVAVDWTDFGPGHAIVSVGGQTVVLSHPRPSQQASLQEAIVRDFCRRVDCLSLQFQGDSDTLPVLRLKGGGSPP